MEAPTKRDYAQMTESEILAEIEHYKHRLAQFEPPRDKFEAARREVYAILLEHRRQLLAALRAGRPGDWLYEQSLG